MGTSDLAALRARADTLDVGEEALDAYSQILDLDPEDHAAANMIGRSLQELGRDEEAREHWAFIVELQPDNTVAAGRLRSLRPAKEPFQVTTSRPTKPAHTPKEILEPALEGAGRDGALRFLARSILMIEKIDPARLAVTERTNEGRFRIYGGREPAVTPVRGQLQVWVHGPAVTPALEAAATAIGIAPTKPDAAALLPDSREYRVPFADVDGLAGLLIEAHREHVLRSIAEGAPPWGHPHDTKLRDYIVSQAANAAG